MELKQHEQDYVLLVNERQMKGRDMKTKLGTNRSRPPYQTTRGRRPAKPSRKPAPDDRSIALPQLKRILVPIDFSDSSLKALRYAVPFAEKFGATIYLVHVLEPPFLASNIENLGLAIPQRELAQSTREKLLSLAAQEIEELVPVSAEVRTGRAFDQIAAVAKELDVDLIIIATHGYTGLKHILLGSTAERVVRHAPCPVLTVREREREFV